MTRFISNRIRLLRPALCAALCAALLCGCAAGSASSAEAKTPLELDPLTGQQSLYPGQRPVAIVIDNASDTYTQWGVASASVVLEAVNVGDGGSTELCLVYPALDAVPRVGPVAAGQDLYWRVLSAQQVIPVQRGGDVYNENYLSYYNITPIDAFVVGRNAFSCPSSWSNTPPWYTDGSALSSVLGSLNITSSISAAGKTVLRTVDAQTGQETLRLPPLLSFGDDEPAEEGYEGAQNVRISFDSANATAFSYDEASSAYLMRHKDGSALIDANTNAQAAFDNLLVLYSSPSLRDDGKTPDYDLTVGGGVWLHGGVMYSITWRQGSDSTFAFYSGDGKQLDIAPGRSYIAIVASINGDELTVTNDSGQALPT